MSQSLNLSANFLDDKLNKDMWYVSDPMGYLGTDFL